MAVVVAVFSLVLPGGSASAATDSPAVSAPAAIVIEASSGDVAWSRQPEQKRAIASTTKMMTALVARQKLALNTTVRAVPYAALAVESKIDLQPGEEMRVADLLRALMLASANDAAVTLAVAASGSRAAFVSAMNARAKQLGLEGTHFANPVGLDDPDNYSTAADLAALARVVRADAFLRTVIALPAATLRSGASPRTVVNRNALVRRGLANGVKTGRTQRAGYVLVGSKSRDGITVISAVLGAATEAAREADTQTLLDWALARYHRERVVATGKTMANLPVRFRDEPAAAVAAHPVDLVVRAGRNVTVDVGLTRRELEGPVTKGTPVGRARIFQDGVQVAQVPLVTAVAIPKAGMLARFRVGVSDHFWTFVLGAVGLGGTLWAWRRRRRAGRRRADEGERRRAKREAAHAALDEGAPIS